MFNPVLCLSECLPPSGCDGRHGEARVSGGGRAGTTREPHRHHHHQEKKMRRGRGLDGAVAGADDGAGARLPSERRDGRGRVQQNHDLPQLHGNSPLHLPGDEKRQDGRLEAFSSLTFNLTRCYSACVWWSVGGRAWITGAVPPTAWHVLCPPPLARRSACVSGRWAPNTPPPPHLTPPL